MNQEGRQPLLDALFENVTESIIVTNHLGIILLVNPATEMLFGYASAELLQKPVEILIPERFAAKHGGHRDHYNQQPRPRSMGMGLDLFARRKDGSELPVSISLSPFEAGNEKYVIAFIIDITRRKEAEMEIAMKQEELMNLTRELKAINEKLENKVEDRTKVLREALFELEKSKSEVSEALVKEKELNELKSRFLSMASHEFRTPLTTILSSVALIDEYVQTGQAEKGVKHVHRIKSAVHNLNDILSDFLSITKIEEGRVIADILPVDIEALTLEVIADMKNICKPGQEIQYQHKGAVWIASDKKLLRNIFINLLSNAIKFSGEGSQIQIETNTLQYAFNICVRDNGIGISEEDKKHLFERFFRAQNAVNVQGTGLGLNIVANYVELLQGKISFHSQLGSGTAFHITIPITKSKP